MKRRVVFRDSEGSLEITVPQSEGSPADVPEFGQTPEPARVKVGRETVEFGRPEDFDAWINALTEAKKSFEEERRPA